PYLHWLSERISFMIDQNAGEKTLILQASSPAISDTLFDNFHAQRLQNQSGYAEVVCRSLISVPVLPEVHQVSQVLAPGCVPLFLTDGFREYTTALLTHYGQWVQFPRQRAQGPVPKPRWMPCTI